MIVMPGAWRCEQHRLWTNGDCPDCDADLIAATDATAPSTQSKREEDDALVDLVVRAWCGVRDDLTWQRTTDPSEREWLRGKARAVLAALSAQSERAEVER